MPKVRWSAPVGQMIRDFDRERQNQFKPFKGTLPPSGTYLFKVKTLKYVAGTQEKPQQLRAGLELVGRDDAERKYAKYYITHFMNIGGNEKAAFTWVPFVDALGVSAKAFETGMLTDTEGNVTKIGSWVNDGETLVFGQLRKNTYEGSDRPLEIAGIYTVEDGDFLGDDGDTPDDDDEYDDDEYDDDDPDAEYDDAAEDDDAPF